MVIFHGYVGLPEGNSSFAMVVSEHGVYRNKTAIFEHNVQPVDWGVAYFPTTHIAKFTYPIGSMYAIHGNIYHQYIPNGSYG